MVEGSPRAEESTTATSIGGRHEGSGNRRHLRRILVIILALTGVIGEGASRAVIIAAITPLAAGYFLYKRSLRPPA